MIHTLFDKTYLINLDKRTDRLATIAKKCKDIGLEYTRKAATDGDLLANPGIDFNTPENQLMRWNINSYALLLTTIEIIKEAKENQYKSILILEDDVDFHAKLSKHVTAGFNTLPENWEMFFLGVTNIKDYSMVSPYVARISGAMYCHGYAISHLGYDVYLEALEKKSKPIDICTLEEIQPRGASYAIIPSMIMQDAGFSDISKKIEEHYILKHS